MGIGRIMLSISSFQHVRMMGPITILAIASSLLCIFYEMCCCLGKSLFCATFHCSDVIMSAMASHITGVSIVYSTVCAGPDQRKHQRFVPLAFVRGISHKRPVARKMFLSDEVIIYVCVPKGTVGDFAPRTNVLRAGIEPLSTWTRITWNCSWKLSPVIYQTNRRQSAG